VKHLSDEDLLTRLFEIPTVSGDEARMISFLQEYASARKFHFRRDAIGNLRVTKGSTECYPAVAAHIDTVHPLRKVTISLQDGIFTAEDKAGHQCGFGADDKTGVFTCLRLLDELPAVAAFFFVQEEIGMIGARNMSPAWMNDIGYLIEFDCPSRYMASATSDGVPLFKEGSSFIKHADVVFESHRGTEGFSFQNHPFTDVATIRRRFPISCLNLASGYHNWHARDEYASLEEIQAAVSLGKDLVSELGETRYHCPIAIPRTFSEARAVSGPRMMTTGREDDLTR
jgi:putative aminopeptidase FrvX